MTLVAKTRIGDWNLEKQIGAGGQGEVWLVRYTESRHSPPGALKICTSSEEKARARFQREAEFLKAYSHLNIVKLRDGGEHEGASYYVMECATVSMESILSPTSGGDPPPSGELPRAAAALPASV